jgi:sulfatase maturation enzyme AslB (radical SAM superfamily)
MKARAEAGMPSASGQSVKQALPLLAAEVAAAPTVPFGGLETLWIQLTGTWCNLECAHCLNASGPRDPWLRPLAPSVVRSAIADAERLGVREIYFTGGEPFLHAEALPLIAESLAVAPTTVLTNGTLVDDEMADALTTLAQRARYSLEIRVSLDDVDEPVNDAVRGAGAWAGALDAVARLVMRGLLPIVTATDVTASGATRRYDRLHDFLVARGVARPRLKLMPTFALGRRGGGSDERLTDAALDGFDRASMQCARARVVADGGVYACPILAGLPNARLSTGSLEDAFRPAVLYHPACVTCHRTGMTCANG